MPYLGVAPNPRENREVDDISSGFNGGTTQFTLQSGGSNVSPGKDTAIIVSLGGVVQNPGTDYTIAASTITFTTAPASGLSFFGVVLAQSIDIETTADNTVTTAKIVDGAITNAKVNASAAIAGTKISPDFGSQNIATTGSATIGSDLIHAGDTDTKISFGTDTISLTTNNVTRMTFTGNFIDLPDAGTLRLGNSNDLRISHGSGGASNIVHSNTSQPLNISATGAGNIAFLTNSNERMRIDSSGRVHIANTGLSATAEADDLTVGNLTGGHGITIFANSSEGGFLNFGDTSTTGTDSRAGVIRYQHSDNSMRFATNGNNERLRIHSDGEISHQTTSVNLQGGGASDFMFTMRSDIGGNHNGMMIAQLASGFIGLTTKPSACHDYIALNFLNCTPVSVGSIVVGSGGVVYNTSSDYRLKENAVSISDGITRLKQLLPKRFNWIADETNTLQDGFFAHEVSSIVPEAVTGEKDAVATENGGQYTKGKPIYQQIDHSKLVPLLVAAVKELITKVETLEAA